MKAPFSRPNSSLSMRFAGRAAQFIVIIGLSLRVLISCMRMGHHPLARTGLAEDENGGVGGRYLLSPEENVLEGTRCLR